MSSVIESVMNILSGDTLQNISKELGAPQDKTKQAITDVIALLTGALAQNSAKKEGAQELTDALEKDHDGSILNNLSSYINNYQSGEGNGILNHVLGSNRGAVEQGLAKKNGLDASTISNLLTIAAPIIMGALGKTQKQEGLNLNSLKSFLGKEQNQAQNIAPTAIDILNKVIRPKSESSQNMQSSRTSAKNKSPIVALIIIIVIVVIGFFLLRFLGIL